MKITILTLFCISIIVLLYGFNYYALSKFDFTITIIVLGLLIGVGIWSFILTRIGRSK